MKEIKEYLNKWRDTACSWEGRLSIGKISVFPQFIQCQHNPIQNSNKLFCGFWKSYSKAYIEKQKPRRANIILKKSKVEGLTPHYFKTGHGDTWINTGWYWQINKQLDQYNRMERPDVDSYKCSQLIIGKGAKAVEWRTKVFSTNGIGTNGHPHANKWI